ncbi:hypothetical protein TWF718_000468 [Orbilia javanica]|uniref:Uncharacterized protein n=1 Tax=Orbilia javanica TaxID=47235 RepID=A0AAN8MX70_9PEZI
MAGIFYYWFPSYVIDGYLNEAVILLPTFDGMILGHGKLLLADDDIKTRDLSWPSVQIFFLAVYPEDAFEAVITIGSPLLEALANPGPTWAKPKHIYEFEEMASTMHRSFKTSRAKIA